MARPEARTAAGVLGLGAAARTPPSSWSRPSGSATTRCGRPRPTAPTPSPRWPGGGRAPPRSASAPPCASSRPARPRPWPWPRSPSTTCAAAASSSAWASRDPRWSRAGTASPSPSPWPAPASTSPSSARCSPARRPVTNDGPHYPLPYPGGTGLGKPLKPIVHPLRNDIPIVLGAEGPKNVALAAEIADGWFPIFFSPDHMGEFDAVARRGLRPARGPARRPRTSRSSPSARWSSTTTSSGPPTLPAHAGPLHRRDGGQGDELPLRRVRAHGLRGRGAQDPGALPRRPQGRRRRRGAHVDGGEDRPHGPARRSATSSRRWQESSPPPCSWPATPPPCG